MVNIYLYNERFLKICLLKFTLNDNVLYFINKNEQSQEHKYKCEEKTNVTDVNCEFSVN